MDSISSRRKERKSGQAILFLLIVMVIGLLVVLWNYDLHNIVSTKVRIDTAGDSAALSAARWQGITLNMIGELNLIQAAHICESFVDPEDLEDIKRVQAEAEEIALLRSRLSLNGPLMGFVAAESAAFLNLRQKDVLNRERKISSALMQRANQFISAGEYFSGIGEAYPGAWFEYGSLLASIAGNTMMVDSANTQYYHFFNGSHILLDPDFYAAIAAKHWCYFKRGSRRSLIDNYTSFEDWDPLPDSAHRTSINSEYFSLKLVKYNLRLRGFASGTKNSVTNYYGTASSNGTSGGNQLEQYYREELTSTFGVGTPFLPYVFDINFSWHLFNVGQWMGKWPTSETFPFEEGVTVKDEYNYRGADAAVNCYINAENITPGIRIDSDWIYWAAAAKPFGYLQDPDSSGIKRVPFYFGVVLPCFRHARLIHNALSSRSNGLRPGADEHFYKHLRVYMREGIEGIRGFDCWYCEQLIEWEESSFREEGSQWLEDHQDGINKGEICVPIRMYNGGGGGGHNSGGSTMGRG